MFALARSAVCLMERIASQFDPNSPPAAQTYHFGSLGDITKNPARFPGRGSCDPSAAFQGVGGQRRANFCVTALWHHHRVDGVDDAI